MKLSKVTCISKFNSHIEHLKRYAEENIMLKVDRSKLYRLKQMELNPEDMQLIIIEEALELEKNETITNYYIKRSRCEKISGKLHRDL